LQVNNDQIWEVINSKIVLASVVCAVVGASVNPNFIFPFDFVVEFYSKPLT
jgi:hypothetical protein